MTIGVGVSARRNYWLNLFTFGTWRTFIEHGAKVTGFRERRWKIVQEIKPGDYLLCYLTGVSRWIGVLVVTGDPFFERTPVWSEDLLPARLPVKPVVALMPETAVPIFELRDQLSLFKRLKNPDAWTGRLRSSPAKWSASDGEIILEALLEAKVRPVVRDVDQRKLSRRPSSLQPKLGEFTVPENDTLQSDPINISGFREPSTHTEIQWLLLKLGNDMGLDVWVARNDRGRSYGGHCFSELPRLIEKLPRQFDETTTRTIELIDVLWLQRQAIVAAFEIESTTLIYSGLLRMADLVAMQPNLNIPLYLVAPSERRAKVIAEINRPTFARLAPPLNRICRFISFTKLREKIYEAEPVLGYLRPEFIREIAESCDDIA